MSPRDVQTPLPPHVAALSVSQNSDAEHDESDSHERRCPSNDTASAVAAVSSPVGAAPQPVEANEAGKGGESEGDEAGHEVSVPVRSCG